MQADAALDSKYLVRVLVFSFLFRFVQSPQMHFFYLFQLFVFQLYILVGSVDDLARHLECSLACKPPHFVELNFAGSRCAGYPAVVVTPAGVKFAY